MCIRDSTNGVERSFSIAAAGPSRSTNTQVTGTGSPTIINLNRQLPPDLAKQHVNPLTLPGFSLPSGQNGLFRLSGQSVSNGQVVQGRSGPQSWTMGGVSVGLAQRQQALPETQGRTIHLDDVSQLSANSRQVLVAAREASGITANASTLNVSGVGNADTGVWQPGRVTGGDITQVDGINTQNPVADPSQSLINITRPDLDLPALTPAERDARIAVNTPDGLSGATRPDLHVPGLSTVDRGTHVSGVLPGDVRPDLNLPGLTPLARDRQVAVGTQQPTVAVAVATASRDPLVVVAPVAGPETLSAGSRPALVVAQPLTGQPTSFTSQTINRVQGLASSNAVSQPHKYLIETNPVLTNLKQFMSSDYLLDGLGYNPDQSAKRLGDGLYEQRLIQQAIVERTGQRFIDGKTSDEAMFRYLMDNAIRSKQALDMSVGVSLTAQQVAALTHDIVWLEEHVVNGEKVLVPVLYLAQADNRLAPNGALIAGQDVSLIAGKDLENAGILHASNNLSAVAGNDLINSGLIQAGNRLDLLAGNNIVNKSGGIIAGRDVSMTAVNGDVINERTVTGAGYNIGFSKHTDYIDSAARIEAANDLSIRAGRDVTSAGGVLQSGNDTTIVAGRDVNLIAAQQHDTMNGGKRNRSEEITQSGSSVEAGRDLKVTAGRDFTAIASEIEAKRDVSMSAGGDIYLASGADEQHSHSKTSSTKRQEDHVSQISTSVTAGRDVTLSAGKDLALIASRISSGDEAYLVAGNNLGLLSAEDSDYSLYDMKRGGGFGSGKTQRDEVTDVKNIGSQIKTGGDLTIQSQGDQKYQVARLVSGEDLTIVSGGAVTFEGMKDLHQESHEKSKSSFAWNSMSGKGNTDEALRQTQIIAKGDIVIEAVDGLHIDVKQVNQQTVSQSIDAMVQADPQLAWLKEVEKRGDVDWRQVKEVHDSYKYSHSGLGAGAQIVIAILVVYFTAGLASGLIGAGATAGSGTAMAAAGTASASAVAGGAAVGSTVAAGWANVALTAIATGAASNATISFINNGGNLGAVLKDVTAKGALRDYVVSGVTAGLTAGLFDKMTGTTTAVEGALPNAGKVLAEGGLSSLEGIGRFGANQLLQNGTSTLLDRALGGNSQFDNALRTSLANTFAAAGFNLVGDIGKKFDLTEGGLSKIGLHAVMGGLAAEAAGGDFKSGALSAGLNEALIDVLAKQYEDMKPDQKEKLLVMNSQLIGVIAAAAGGGDAKDLQTGSWVAQNSTQYNRQLHPDEIEFASDKERVKRFAAQNGLTEDQAQKELLRTAAAMVDRGWDSILTEGKTEKAANYLRAELTQFKNDSLFKVSLADYNNERVGLVELFKDRTALDKMLKNVALVDPLAYRTDIRYMREVLDAKGRGSQEGFAFALESMASGASKTALWAMGAANCPSCAATDIEAAWNSVLKIPEELRLKGYLDNLHIMQGGGAAVIQGNAAASTAAGVGIGLAIDGGLSGMTTSKAPIGGSKELGRVDPPIPKVDVTDDFRMNVFKDGGVQLKYGDPDGVAGLVVNVDKAGVLGFEIRAAQNHPYFDASGTDMFASAMQRLGNEGIKVNQIRGAWEAGTDSVNTARYLENIANGMSKENAALNTWTGQIAQKYGYGKVENIETIGDINYVTFKK